MIASTVTTEFIGRGRFLSALSSGGIGFSPRKEGPGETRIDKHRSGWSIFITRQIVNTIQGILGKLKWGEIPGEYLQRVLWCIVGITWGESSSNDIPASFSALFQLPSTFLLFVNLARDILWDFR